MARCRVCGGVGRVAAGGIGSRFAGLFGMLVRECGCCQGIGRVSDTDDRPVPQQRTGPSNGELVAELSGGWRVEIHGFGRILAVMRFLLSSSHTSNRFVARCEFGGLPNWEATGAWTTSGPDNFVWFSGAQSSPYLVPTEYHWGAALDVLNRDVLHGESVSHEWTMWSRQPVLPTELPTMTRTEPAADRVRGAEIRSFPPRRRLVTGALRAGRRSSVMHGLFEVDVTDALGLLHATTPRLSLTAFLVSCVGRSVAAYPEVHAYRDWRGRLVTARHVDVGTLVEVSTEDGPLPTPHLIRDADVRDVADISAEIRAVQRDSRSSRSGRLLDRYAPAAGRVPGLIPLFYLLLRRSPRMREMCGTVAVSAIGMFGHGGGFGIAAPGILSLTVVVGGTSEHVRVIDGQIQVRHILDLTVSIDHAVVDGAPAARFVAHLRGLIEDPGMIGIGASHQHGGNGEQRADDAGQHDTDGHGERPSADVAGPSCRARSRVSAVLRTSTGPA